MIRFTVATEEAGTRLDVVLAARFDVSRARAQKLLKEDAVTVNDRPAIAHQLVKEGEAIVCAGDAKGPKQVKEKQLALDIVFENKEVLVINKPAGLLVHPNTETETKPSVAMAAVKHDKKIAKIGENKLRPGIVHRLDKDVSGLMVIAKTQEAFESLKHQFATHETEKHYVALCYGVLPKDDDMILLKIARSKKRGRMVARPEGQEGKEAITEYHVKERLKTNTLVDVRTHTGRTHQIRTHFFAINHPLVGDVLYRKDHMRHIRPINLGRVFLHASELAFKLPDGTPLRFTAPLPPELKTLLDSLPRL